MDGIARLLAFLLGEGAQAGSATGSGSNGGRGAAATAVQALMSGAARPGSRQRLARALPVLREFAPAMRDFGLQISRRLVEKNTARVLRAGADAIFGPLPVVAGAVGAGRVGASYSGTR